MECISNHNKILDTMDHSIRNALEIEQECNNAFRKELKALSVEADRLDGELTKSKTDNERLLSIVEEKNELIERLKESLRIERGLE